VQNSEKVLVNIGHSDFELFEAFTHQFQVFMTVPLTSRKVSQSTRKTVATVACQTSIAPRGEV
jgi:hypothetical protein